MLDSRTLLRSMEWLEHERSVRFRNADALIVDRCGQPFRGDGRADRDRGIVRCVFQSVAEHVFEHLPDAPGIDLQWRKLVQASCHETPVLAGCGKITAQTRDQRCERHRAALENEWIRLEMSNVEDVLHQCGESLRRLINSFEVVPLLAGPELQMEKGVRVARE